MTGVGLTAARKVADAVLHEGYLLYPYRASAAKNQVRWQYGVLGPVGAAAAGVGEAPAMAADALLETAPGATVDVTVRFLQVQARAVQRWTGSGWLDVAELPVEGARWVPYSEGVAREVVLDRLPASGRHVRRLEVPAGEQVEELREQGRLVGRLVRTRWALRGTLVVTAGPGRDPRVTVLRLRARNDLAWDGRAVPGWSPRDVAARTSFVGTHLLVTVSGGRVLSLLDGPDWSRADATGCVQERCWPALVGADDGSDALLVAPVVLGDHPRVAPESAGDLFDATEIDEILTLRVLTLTDDEREQARGTDPRAAAVLDRCAGLTEAALSGLHGGRRDPGPGDVPAWDPGESARPESDTALVGGVPVRRGSRVRLRPARGADAQDLFLAGASALVARVYDDVDGGTHVAVVLEDDPGRDLADATGRYRYFAPDELEVLPPGAGAT